MNTAWNPDLYLKLQQERTQPSIDLVSRIELEDPGRIIDIGCGPGNSTRVLRDRWPNAEIIGADNSEQMISVAKRDYPKNHWLLSDARKLSADEDYDLVYSNAAIQWIPDHEALLSHLLGMLRPGGALAVQVPRFGEMPIRRAIITVADRDRWRSAMEGSESALVYYPTEFYYDCLSARCAELSEWTTWYIHEMESHDAIIEMIKSTGMRPFLERLKVKSEKDDFIHEVLQEVRLRYPARPNNRVLFPFIRFFFIAYL